MFEIEDISRVLLKFFFLEEAPLIGEEKELGAVFARLLLFDVCLRAVLVDFFEDDIEDLFVREC